MQTMKPVSYAELFRYASALDKVCIVVAIISAAIAGCGFPLTNILAGKIFAVLAGIEDGVWICNKSTSKPELTKTESDTDSQKTVDRNIALFSLFLALAGVMQLIFAYLAISLLNQVAENQTYRIRVKYVKALLRQDIGWYDLNTDSSFVTRIVEDVRKVHEAIASKLGLFIYYADNSILCLIISFYYGWLLTAVVLSIAPLSALISFAIEICQSKLSVKQQLEYSQCGSIIQQALINIKTVMAFSGQEKELEKYKKNLVLTRTTQDKRAIIAGLGLGFSWLLKYCSYSLAIWYGTKLAYDDAEAVCKRKSNYNIETVFIVLFSVLDLEYNFSECVKFLETFSIGRGAASAIFGVIDSKPDIDSSSPEGIRGVGSLAGKIEFKNVTFSYPSRPDVKVLDGFNLTIEPGITVALVGPSGCGKSTCLQLLQRLYDPTDGSILVDGIDIREYNVKWFRSQLAVVNQEPALFNTTIEDNIRYGRPDVSLEELEHACELANAHGFVSRLPNKYQTLVGDRGAQLSGGQKQRIAISRALIQDPAILLLDEITSALDLGTEAIVQRAIDIVKEGRTTITVAHRVSTLKSAGLIAWLQNGQVLAQGTPKEIRQRSDLPISKLLSSSTEFSGILQEPTGDGSSVEPQASLEDVQEDATVNQKDDDVAKDDEYLDEKTKALVSTKTVCKIASMNKKEWPAIAVGLLMSLVHGLILPVTGYLIGTSLKIFSMTKREKAEKMANEYALVFLLIGVVSLMTEFISLACFGFAGGSLTVRLRAVIFGAMMKQDLAWFQQPQNSVGILCTRLSRDVANVQEATGTYLGLSLGALTTIIISIALCFYINWKLALVGWAMSPLILIGAYWNGRLVETQETLEKDAHEKASNIIFQAVSNIRTVAVLCLEERFIQQFLTELDGPYRSAKRKAHVLGIVFGASQAACHFAYAAVLYYGATLVNQASMKPENERELNYGDVFTIGEALVWTILEIGFTLAYLPNYSKAKVSAAHIFALLKQRTDIDPDKGIHMKTCDGSVVFDHVQFAYKTRPSFPVLKDVSWEAKPRAQIAICGPSGSGKSTIVDLLLRLYDPSSGTICVDDMNIKAINIESLRSQMSIVSQEPALFDSSFADNIAYGVESMKIESVENAAKMANIHDFIMTLPYGYSTRVGAMGAQLSGGQKQRVAIARALARSPRILLLDEATSALDADSEKMVEEALSYATEGRTCIKVAHKLETIQKSDTILVLRNGILAEVGNHEELLSRGGIYYNLWSLQTKKTI